MHLETSHLVNRGGQRSYTKGKAFTGRTGWDKKVITKQNKQKKGIASGLISYFRVGENAEATTWAKFPPKVSDAEFLHVFHDL